MTFVPTRAAGLATLDVFVARAGRHYAETRNFDFGPEDRSNVSMLSPYLRYRLVTEAEVLAAVRRRHTPAAAEKFIQEVLWRSYWKGWLELRPTVWTDYLAEVAALESQSGGWRRDYERALAGQTGIDCFDAWIGELAEHGYLHNHARMWFASIWIFTLRLPWQLGAALFWQQLYDGDPASNTLSWRWVAGLQTTGKTYLARADNIARYTDGRFDPVGLATAAAAPTAPPSPVPQQLSPTAAQTSGRVGLLISEDDLAPETLPVGDGAIAATACLVGDYGRSMAVEAFAAASLADAGARARNLLGASATVLPVAKTAEAGADEVRDWARANELRSLITAYAPIGPGADRLALITTALAADDIAVIRLRRDWDTAAWPHAQRGFFAFRERFKPYDPLAAAKGG
jgi:deoxyribodipyrimidine photo-lyase